MSRPARALLFLVRVYQAFFSALMPSACKFYPSCSHYAADAVRIHGARRGAWLALRRVLRCHPFTRGGVDLVPEANDAPSSEVPSFSHFERSEESLLRSDRRTEGFFASLRMTRKGGRTRGVGDGPGAARISGPRSENLDNEVCVTQARRRDWDEAKL